MRVLFIGGTGIISSACSELALERGIELYLLCRGKSPRPIPKGARVLNGDVRDAKSALAALGKLEFDAVADFISFVPEHIQAARELFAGRTRQFLFISSASAYKKPVDNWPLTESTPLHNPHWQYSRNKIACEDLLLKAYRESSFPATIVRPSHTYDKTLLPLDPYQCGYTVLQRIKQGKPVIVHGDGTSLWVLTHHRDFAKGFVGLPSISPPTRCSPGTRSSGCWHALPAASRTSYMCPPPSSPRSTPTGARASWATRRTA